MNYGFQSLQPGLSTLAEGVAQRQSPESRQYRANLEELTQWITPNGEISRSAPREIRNELETIMAEGRLYYDPSTPNSFGVVSPGESIPQGMKPFAQGKTFYDVWGPTKQTEDGKQHYNKDSMVGAMEEMVRMGDQRDKALQGMQPPQQAQPPMQSPTPIPQMMMQQPMQQPGIQELMQMRAQQMQQQPPDIGLPSFSQPQQNPFAQMLGMQQGPPVQRYEQGGQINDGLAQLRELMGLDRGEVPIIAHEGEYVLNRDAVNAIGPQNLDRVNNLMQQAPRYSNGGVVGWNFDKRKEVAETSKNRQGEIAQQEAQQRESERTIQSPAADIMGGLNRVAADMPTKDDEIFKEIGRQVAEKLMDFGRNAPEQGYNRVAGVAEAQQESSTRALDRRRPTQASGRPTNVPKSSDMEGVDAVSGAQPLPDYRRDRPMGGNGQPTSGDMVNREKAVRPPAGPPKQNQTQPSPPVNPPNKGEVPNQQGEAEPGPKEEDTSTPKPSMDRPFYRSPNAAQNINWEQLSDLNPGQAMSYLQQYANTQGVQTNVDVTGQRGNPNREMFADLVGHYATIKGLEDKVNQQKWRDLIGSKDVEKAKLEIAEMKAMSPYTTDLTEAKLNLTNAQTRNLLAQAEAAEEQVGRDLSIDPSQMLSAMKDVETVKGKIVDDMKDAMNTSLRFAQTQENSKEAWKDFYEKQLIYDMVSGAMSPHADYEEAVKSIGEGPKKKWFSDKMSVDDTLSKEEYGRAQAQAMTIMTRMNQFDQVAQTAGSGGMLMTLLQQIAQQQAGE